MLKMTLEKYKEYQIQKSIYCMGTVQKEGKDQFFQLFGHL